MDGRFCIMDGLDGDLFVGTRRKKEAIISWVFRPSCPERMEFVRLFLMNVGECTHRMMRSNLCQKIWGSKEGCKLKSKNCGRFCEESFLRDN